MNKKIIALALVALLSLGACAAVPPQAKVGTLATAALTNAAGQNIGMVEIVQSGAQLMFRANVSGQTPGAHGLHLHTTGKCEAPAFNTAGGHLNPTAHQHGNLNKAGPHIGDLPNIMVGPDGSGTITSPLMGAPDDFAASMFDVDGTAIVLHDGPDDYKTDPNGNSGGRIACGELLRFLARAL